jgi:hypothetical protein
MPPRFIIAAQSSWIYQAFQRAARNMTPLSQIVQSANGRRPDLTAAKNTKIALPLTQAQANARIAPRRGG